MPLILDVFCKGWNAFGMNVRHIVLNDDPWLTLKCAKHENVCIDSTGGWCLWIPPLNEFLGEGWGIMIGMSVQSFYFSEWLNSQFKNGNAPWCCMEYIPLQPPICVLWYMTYQPHFSFWCRTNVNSHLIHHLSNSGSSGDKVVSLYGIVMLLIMIIYDYI